jgi:hypothetical protein
MKHRGFWRQMVRDWLCFRIRAYRAEDRLLRENPEAWHLLKVADKEPSGLF